MTLRSIIDKYMGWCPQFNLTYNSSPPRFEFTSGGKLAFTILIVLLGILETLGAIGMVTFQDTTILWYYWVNKLAGTLLLITYPLLIILTLDVLLTKGLKKRHTYEFAAVIATYTASRIPRIYPDTQYLLARASVGFLDTGVLIGLIDRLTLVLLGVYIIVRLLRGKGILVKQTFLILTVYSALLFVGIFQSWVGFSWDYSSIWQTVAVTRLFLIWGVSSYILVAVYFMSIYLKLSRGSVTSIVLSWYARAALFLHGSYNIVNIVYNDFYPKPGYLIFNLDMNNIALDLIVYSAFIVASFFSFSLPLKVQQGEVK
jgi:hypothetical protein